MTTYKDYCFLSADEHRTIHGTCRQPEKVVGAAVNDPLSYSGRGTAALFFRGDKPTE